MRDAREVAGMALKQPQGALPEVRITPADVGRRVSVRRILQIAEGRPVFGDVIGVLISWDAGLLVVARRDGTAVEVAEELLVAGKPVPPAPARRAPLPQAGPEELQRTAARGWPAVETEPLGAWTLRAAGGFTRRANSVQALGDPGLPLDDALQAVAEWYRCRGLPAHVEVTVPGSPPGLREALARLGAEEAPTLFRTAPLASLTRAATGLESVRLARTATPDWLSRYRRVGGDPALERAARQVIDGGPSVWFATVPAGPSDGSLGPEHGSGPGPLAIGRCVVDGPWAGFSAIEVISEQRRRGLATVVMAALAARAAEEGATGAYLQVEADNQPAITLYDRLGFTTSHTYHYCRLPQLG